MKDITVGTRVRFKPDNETTLNLIAVEHNESQLFDTWICIDPNGRINKTDCPKYNCFADDLEIGWDSPSKGKDASEVEKTFCVDTDSDGNLGSQKNKAIQKPVKECKTSQTISIPCKPGDHVWVLFRNYYAECEVTKLTLTKYPNISLDMWVIDEERPIQGSSSEFGFTLFRTEEEVSRALEKEEEEKSR